MRPRGYALGRTCWWGGARSPPARPSLAAATSRTLATAPTTAADGGRGASATTSDYVVVGAGSAGCVIASRLAEAGRSVTLLEGGMGTNGSASFPSWSSLKDLFVRMPTALAWPMSFEQYNWGFGIEPEESLGGRVVSCPRGKGLGGSSAINGMVFVRGHPEDFEAWDRLGARGWSYAGVLPYFKKMENWSGGEDQYRGSSGPLHVKNGENAAGTPLYDLFVQAGDQAGYGATEDYNGYRQEGFGAMPMTIYHGGGPQGDNQRPPKCVGVSYLDQRTGKLSSARARQEVIVCAGSIQSPQLLQVSGIGDRAHLESIGVEGGVVVDNPNVGRNLQDHLELYFQQEVLEPVSIAPVLSSPLTKLRLALEWMLTGKGLGATNHFESAAFVRSSTKQAYPDVQFHFLPVGISYDGVTLAESRSGHSMQVHVGTCRSESRGYVAARSPDALVPPEIKFNYMSREEDWEQMRAAINIARQVMRQPALQGIAGAEILPGEVYPDVDAYIRDHVESAYHPCGTCKMGTGSGDGAVVDPQAQVLGCQGLRVADASIFPRITNGNLNAPTIMVAERVSDMILDRLLPPAEFPAGREPYWKPESLDIDREKEPLIQ